MDELELADWRRQVATLYSEVRASPPGAATWQRWRDGRDLLMRAHPQTPVAPSNRAMFRSMPFFAHDPALRFEVRVESAPGPVFGSDVPMRTIGTIGLPGARLTVFWLEGYAGGLFLPFRDVTNGTETYGGGRYVLDGAKGADLGGGGDPDAIGDVLVVDFNYAYHPSCAHDPRWSCPLAPPENAIPWPVRAGERLGAD